MEKLINRVGLSWVYDQIKLDLVNIYNLLISNPEVDFENKCKEIDYKLCHIAKVFYLLNISGGVSFINEFRLNIKFYLLNSTSNTDKIIATADKIEQVLNYIDDIIQGYGDLPVYYVSVIDELRSIREEILFSECSYVVNSVKQHNISNYDCEFTNIQKNNITESLLYLLKNFCSAEMTSEKLLKNADIIKKQFKGTQHYILWDIIHAYFYLQKNYNYQISNIAFLTIKEVIEGYNKVFDTLDFERITDDISNWIATLSFDLLYSGYFTFLESNIVKFVHQILAIDHKKSLTNYMSFVDKMLNTDSWILLLDIASELDLAINKLTESKHKRRVDVNWLLELIQKHIDSCILTGTYDPLEYYYQAVRTINQYTISGGFISSDDLEIIEQAIIDLTKNVETAIHNSREDESVSEEAYAQIQSSSTQNLDGEAREALLNQQIIELDKISSEIIIKSDLSSEELIKNFRKILGIFTVLDFKSGTEIIKNYLDKLEMTTSNQEMVSDSLRQNVIVYIKYLSELIKAILLEADFDFHLKSLKNLSASLEVAGLSKPSASIEDDVINNKTHNQLIPSRIKNKGEFEQDGNGKQQQKDSHFAEQISAINKVNTSSNSASSLKQIFFEEFAEINDSLSVLFREWRTDRHSSNLIESIQRELHTLKGAARMVGFYVISDWIHHIESVVEIAELKLNLILPNHVRQIEQAYSKTIDLVGAYRVNIVPSKPDNVELTFIEDDGTNNDNDVPDGVSIASLLKTTKHVQNKIKQEDDSKPAIPLRSTVRVNKEELDELLDAACELSISQHQLVQQNQYFTQVLKKIEALSDLTPNEQFNNIKNIELIAKELQSVKYNYHNICESSDKNTNSIFNKLINLRMVPLSAIRERIEHLAYVIADELNKEIKFTIRKTEGSIDCVVLEQITPCIEHLVRNAIAHGIETPDVRHNIRKDRVGKVELSLHTHDQAVIIDVSDDGNGLDIPKIQEKAKQLGLCERDTDLHVDDLLPIITSNKFSTSDDLSQISGRGIGLNVVKDIVAQLCGTIELDTKPNIGTKFTIKLPFSLAKQSLLFVKLADLYYALPSLIVTEIKRVPCSEIAAFNSNYIYKDIIVYDLYNLLNLDNALSNNKLDASKNYNIVVVNYKNNQIGLLVEAVCETRQSVVRPLSKQLRALTEFMGGTIYQDGRVVLVLDIFTILANYKRNNRVNTISIPVSDGGPRTSSNDVISDASSSIVYTDDEPEESDDIFREARVNLEFTDRVKQVQSKRESETESNSNTYSTSKKTNVLVVEDSATVRHAISTYLDPSIYNIINAVDGVDGLKKLRKKIPDIILLDIAMPRMSGIEFLKRIRQTKALKYTPVIVMSSRDDQSIKEAVMQLNVDVYLKKPYDQTRLVNAVEYVLNDG